MKRSSIAAVVLGVVWATVAFMIALTLVGCSESQLSDEARRENLLMPKAGTKSHTEWVGKYGDTADSWELFTIGFHTRYAADLNKRITALEAAAIDPNDIVEKVLETPIP